MGITDGLGGEEVNQTVTVTEVVSGTNVYGTTSVQSAYVNGTAISGGAANITGNFTAGSSYQQNFTYSQGTKVINLVAEAIISGGMWVVGSAASGASTTPVLKPAPANTGQPLGICLATTASGASASVLVQGFYKGIVAEGTLNNGVGVSMGAGTALNCAKAAAAGTTRGTVVMAAGSEGVLGIYLW